MSIKGKLEGSTAQNSLMRTTLQLRLSVLWEGDEVSECGGGGGRRAVGARTNRGPAARPEAIARSLSHTEPEALLPATVSDEISPLLLFSSPALPLLLILTWATQNTGAAHSD